MSDTSRETVEALARDVERYRNLPTRTEAARTLRALLDERDAAEAEVERLREATAPGFELLREQGFAPGSYHCFCAECGKQHIADKRAWRCLECAETRAALKENPDE